MSNSKPCAICGETFRRPTGAARMSEAKWQARKYCSHTCATPMRNVKPCEGCGQQMRRKHKVAQRDWLRQRFCSPECRQTSPEPRRVRVADEAMTFEASNVAMMRALLRYGARHDGLPGLPAEQFYELAEQYGIAA